MSGRLLVIRQRHTQPDLRFPRITEDEIDAALHDAGLPRARTFIDVGGELPALAAIDWKAECRKQALQLQQLQQQGGAVGRVAYFGLTLIPLAVELGRQVAAWNDLHVFQRHHERLDWVWETREQTVQVHVEGVPSKPTTKRGAAIVRVATRFDIDPTPIAAVVDANAFEVDITIDEPGKDALRSDADVHAVAQAFADALLKLRLNAPGLTGVHLFIAGPVGLALRLGAALNPPTMFGPIELYQYDSRYQPLYRRAFTLGGDMRDKTLKILFLAAGPKTADSLRSGEELRDISEGLRQGDKREHFILEEPKFAVRAQDVQGYVRRARANILHLSGHGEPGGAFMLEDAIGRPSRLPPDGLRALIEANDVEQRLKLIIINACHSEKMAEALLRSPAVCEAVIVTRKTVPDVVAIRFADGFYRGLADGVDFKRAFAMAKVQVQIDNGCPRGCEEDFVLCQPPATGSGAD